jgi:hypothetical protein
MPGGVAMFDYDGDGWLDLYFVNGAGLEDPQPAGSGLTKRTARMPTLGPAVFGH